MNLFCDGSGTNGIKCGYCVAREDGKILKHEMFEGLEGKATNNEMEYKAVIEALKEARDGDTIYTDSQLVVNHASGMYKVKARHLKPLAGEVRRLLKMKDVKLQWICREDNVAGWHLEKR